MQLIIIFLVLLGFVSLKAQSFNATNENLTITSSTDLDSLIIENFKDDNQKISTKDTNDAEIHPIKIGTHLQQEGKVEAQPFNGTNGNQGNSLTMAPLKNITMPPLKNITMAPPLDKLSKDQPTTITTKLSRKSEINDEVEKTHLQKVAEVKQNKTISWKTKSTSASILVPTLNNTIFSNDTNARPTGIAIRLSTTLLKILTRLG